MTDSPYKIVATDQNFMETVVEASSSRPVLVDFWAPWCGPCRTLMPMLDRIADEYAGRFTLAKLNTDEAPRVAGHLNIRSIPTVMLFRNGEVVDQFVVTKPWPDDEDPCEIVPPDPEPVPDTAVPDAAVTPDVPPDVPPEDPGALPWWGKNLVLLGAPLAPLGWQREGVETLWRDGGVLLLSHHGAAARPPRTRPMQASRDAPRAVR